MVIVILYHYDIYITVILFCQQFCKLKIDNVIEDTITGVLLLFRFLIRFGENHFIHVAVWYTEDMLLCQSIDFFP